VQLKASQSRQMFQIAMRYGFSGLTMAIGTADVVVCSKQTGFAISCSESAKIPFKYNEGPSSGTADS
jgi:hypothetical protein